MREIKFRAWDKKWSKMYYSFEGDVLLFRGNWELERSDGRGNHIGTAKIDNKNIFLMQFTGLLDKNGKEIYEGDILDVDNKNRTVEVVWFQPQGCFDARPLKIINRFEAFRGLQNADWATRTEVIGNIYENPELLEEK